MPKPTAHCPFTWRSLALAVASAGSVLCTLPAMAAEPFASDSPWLTGDWGGERQSLLEKGYDFSLNYVGELGYNLHGGHDDDRTGRWAGQFTLAAQFDLEKILGWRETSFRVAITEREGRNISNDRISDPRAPMYSSAQEVWGRGQTWRLTQFWIEQAYLDGRVNLKFGRFGVGEAFNSFPCDFQNLAFCGSQMGNWAGGNTWYNWPISQWGAALKYQWLPTLALQIGLFEHNPSLLETGNGFKMNTSGSEGAILPVEAIWTPKVNGLPGEYRVGYYHSTGDADDVLDREVPGDVNSSLRSRSGKYGYWVVAQQQLTSRDGNSGRGLSLFSNLTWEDKATSQVDYFMQAGLVYKGWFDARPQDDIGFGVARVHTNDRFRKNQRLVNAANGAVDYADPAFQPLQGSEYDAELYYGVQATKWLVLRPNIQYVRDPGGVDEVDSAWVFGVKMLADF